MCSDEPVFDAAMPSAITSLITHLSPPDHSIQQEPIKHSQIQTNWPDILLLRNTRLRWKIKNWESIYSNWFHLDAHIEEDV